MSLVEESLCFFVIFVLLHRELDSQDEELKINSKRPKSREALKVARKCRKLIQLPENMLLIRLGGGATKRVTWVGPGRRKWSVSSYR